MATTTTTSSATVCVTGSTGYIASHVVDQLLDQGFHVRATVRSVAESKKYNFLTQLAAAKNAHDRLTFWEADLLKAGSFDPAFEGCTYVIHTASPFIIGKVCWCDRTCGLAWVETLHVHSISPFSLHSSSLSFPPHSFLSLFCFLPNLSWYK